MVPVPVVAGSENMICTSGISTLTLIDGYYFLKMTTGPTPSGTGYMLVASRSKN